MTVREIAFPSAEYASALALRRQVLREPLGLVYSAADLAGDAGEVMLAAFDDDGHVVGILHLRPLEEGRAKMRQVAVAPELQGQGVGRLLVGAAETCARERGWQELTLAARQTAIAFYERLGYETYGEPFVEVTLPHRHMRKRL